MGDGWCSRRTLCCSDQRILTADCGGEGGGGGVQTGGVSRDPLRRA